MKIISTFGFLANHNQLAKKLFFAASFLFFAHTQAQTVNSANCGIVHTVSDVGGTLDFTYSAAYASRCAWSIGAANIRWLNSDPFGATNGPGWYLYNQTQTYYYSSVQTGILAPNLTVGNWTKVSGSMTLSVLNGTGTSSTFAIVLGTGESASKTANQIYPNPTTGIVHLKNAQDLEVVQVYSIDGKLLKSEKINSNDAKIDLSDLPNGIYLIKTKQGTTKIIKK